MLELKNVEAAYGEGRVLFGIDMKIGNGEMVALMGRNGMGKTTTVKTVMGMVKTAKGDITFKGERLTRLPSYKIARKGIGLAPEGRQIFSGLTVKENLVACGRSGHGNGRAGWSLESVYDLFPALAVREKIPGNRLSGGEQQMLSISRALMTNPELLILDEATEGLSPLVRAEIWSALEKLKNSGLSILVIDKNIEALSRSCDRIYIIEKGLVVWRGTAAEFRDEDIAMKFIAPEKQG